MGIHSYQKLKKKIIQAHKFYSSGECSEEDFKEMVAKLWKTYEFTPNDAYNYRQDVKIMGRKFVLLLEALISAEVLKEPEDGPQV
ncbi:MAG: hypothetical protein O2866_00115 [archaeon]|nr:hypothetical protein [archaeon]MDA1167269.1 hypothetical protein [archaeon]